MAKVLGSDIVAFFDSEWPKEWYVDDGTLSAYDGDIVADDNDTVHLPLSEKYDLDDFGFLCGAGNTSLTTFFNRWKKVQTTETLIVEIPKGQRDAATSLFKSHGYKVVR